MANEGVMLVPEGIKFPVVRFTDDKARLDAYSERIAKYTEKARKTSGVLSYSDKDNIVMGSNPFAVVEFASDIVPMPSELEHAARLNPEFFRGTYSDIGLVVRSEEDSSWKANDYVSKDLAKQIKARLGSMPTPENPARVSLRGLSLKEDSNSDYGLVFVVGDNTEVISVPEFAHSNNQKRFARTDERGVPIFDDKGNRTLYTKQTGLSRLCLDGGWDLGLGSGGDDLAYSDSSGRVVEKSAEGAVAQKSAEYVARLEAEKAAQLADLESRFARARDVLTGKAK